MRRVLKRAAVLIGCALVGMQFIPSSAKSNTVTTMTEHKVPGQKKPVITVKPGEQIVLRITSHFGGEQARDGSQHSFVVKKLRGQGWDIRLKEGTQDFTLVAPQEQGNYLIECTVKCGRGHDDMNMKLVVSN